VEPLSSKLESFHERTMLAATLRSARGRLAALKGVAAAAPPAPAAMSCFQVTCKCRVAAPACPCVLPSPGSACNSNRTVDAEPAHVPRARREARPGPPRCSPADVRGMRSATGAPRGQQRLLGRLSEMRIGMRLSEVLGAPCCDDINASLPAEPARNFAALARSQQRRLRKTSQLWRNGRS